MTSLRSLALKNVYRTGKDDLYNDFYKKALSVSTSYDRAVGYFSSEILSMSLKGLSNLIQSNGSMRLIIGHPLTNDEFNAVKHGIALKDLISNFSSKLEEMLLENNEKNNRLKLLSWLIASGKVEIKFALRRAGMYHEKIGIFRDSDNNSVVFQGSANETPHGMVSTLNAESISVYKSWDEQIYDAYGKEFVQGFNRLWMNQEIDILTVDVPSATYEKVAANTPTSPFNAIDLMDEEDALDFNENLTISPEPFIPETIGGKTFYVYEHQKKALSDWKANNYKGILKLATGSGKTITSIYGAVKIYQALRKRDQKMFLVVAVPYIELAIQWVDNLRIFGIHPHECFESRNKWIESFENQINFFNVGILDFCAAIVVNKTLSSPFFSGLLAKIDPNNIFIIGDECHNHGSKKINDALPAAQFRMGLSATPFRSDDDEIDSPFPNEAKKRILEYYGEIVATYGLGDAINDGVLTPYEYFIVPVYLTSAEQEIFEELSDKISKLIIKQKQSGLTKEEKDLLTTNCSKRSRLLGGAKNKLTTLKELTANVAYEEKQHTLFYSGEGTAGIVDPTDEERNIDKVTKILRDNGWKTSQFTGEISGRERKVLMSAFKEQGIDALVAMKVLDEGIDVPACKTAYILASTKNPRQYVQRRGRILRKSPGKSIAKIFDFVVLPINSNSASERLKISEMERINDFALLAENKMQIEKLIQEHGLSYDFN